MKVWPMAVPSDTQLQQLATRIMLWALLVAYVAYAVLLQLTDTATAVTLFPLACAALHLLGLVAFYRGFPLFASVWMTLVLLFDFTMINLYGFNNAQGPIYYFLMVPALIFMVLPPQQREWQISLLTLTLALLSLCFVMPEPTEPWLRLSGSQVHVFKWFDLVLCLLYMAITCRFFIHRLLQQRAQLERLALIDSFTGLPNRHGVMQQLASWFNEGRAFSVLLIDILDYVELSRRLGLDTGDQLVRKLVHRLRTDLAEPIFVGRFTEHQLIVSSDIQSEPASASALAQQVYASIERLAFDLNGHPERIRIQLGATLADADELPQTLLNRLAQALTQSAKQTPPVQLLLAQTLQRPAEVSGEGIPLAPSA